MAWLVHFLTSLTLMLLVILAVAEGKHGERRWSRARWYIARKNHTDMDTKMFTERFRTADKNADGQLCLHESVALARREDPDATQKGFVRYFRKEFRRFDHDNSRSLSEAEFIEMMKAQVTDAEPRIDHGAAHRHQEGRDSEADNHDRHLHDEQHQGCSRANKRWRGSLASRRSNTSRGDGYFNCLNRNGTRGRGGKQSRVTSLGANSRGMSTVGKGRKAEQLQEIQSSSLEERSALRKRSKRQAKRNWAKIGENRSRGKGRLRRYRSLSNTGRTGQERSGGQRRQSRNGKEGSKTKRRGSRERTAQGRSGGRKQSSSLAGRWRRWRHSEAEKHLESFERKGKGRRRSGGEKRRLQRLHREQGEGFDLQTRDSWRLEALDSRANVQGVQRNEGSVPKTWP
eukprot:TRINITY_DN77277_c0_g1_i1.p1 TRINITY_DN77277_c0_g1~~TRINITY_DN77277_c0_g1_i1.p1  ORF type:complete len:400 (-),score=23.54 TRINITY_DN77277_c0_g1_i1:217-1416(-)